MYEIIRVILEIFFSKTDFSNLSEIYKEKRLREIGTDLFLLYVHTYEIVACGENIIDTLEHYLKTEKHQSQEWISGIITEQRMNIIRLRKDIERLSNYLTILDPKSRYKLSSLLYDKQNLLQELIYLMREGNLPLIEPNESDIRQLTKDPDKRYMIKRELYQHMENNLIPLSIPWNEDILEKIKEYLEKRNPRRQLEQIRAVLQQIRVVLESNFSIQDILLEISDRR